MANTTTTTINNLLRNNWVPKAIMTLYQNTPLYELTEKAPMPKGFGNITYWNAWNRLAGASSTLAEAGNNALAQLSSRRVSATIIQAGRGYQISDLAQWFGTLDAIEGGRQTLTNSAMETLEKITHMGIYKADINKNSVSTTNFSSYVSSVKSAFCAINGTHTGDIQFQFPAIFATSTTRLSATSGSAPTISAQLSLFSIRKVVTALRNQNAQPFDDGNYVGYAHPYALHSLMRDQSWVNWNQYMNSKETLYKGEVGSTWGTRWISSTMCPRYGVAARSITGCFIFGKQSVGTTNVKGGVDYYFVDGADSNNSFATYSQLTYKVSAAAAALNPSAGRILFVSERITA